jgi:predicted HicB family RNase H-like nuclease
LTADEYEEIFGAVSEDDTSTALNVQINSAIMARVRQAAAQEGSTLSAWAERALEKALG